MTALDEPWEPVMTEALMSSTETLPGSKILSVPPGSRQPHVATWVSRTSFLQREEVSSRRR